MALAQQNEPELELLFDKLLHVSAECFHFSDILDKVTITMQSIIKKEIWEDLSKEIFSSFQVIEETFSFKER